MNDKLKACLKGVITFGTMALVGNMAWFFSIPRNDLNRVGSVIAGVAAGYVVGDKVSEIVAQKIDDAILRFREG